MAGIPDPRKEPTISVPRAGALCGMGSSKAYVEARKWIDSNGAEGLPGAIRFGRMVRVRTVELLALLGLDASANSSGDDHERDEEPTAAQSAPVTSIDRAKINAPRP
jgi:hypothetical protein